MICPNTLEDCTNPACETAVKTFDTGGRYKGPGLMPCGAHWLDVLFDCQGCGTNTEARNLSFRTCRTCRETEAEEKDE